MGRIRKISQDDILDAAARVITKLGASGLSIDAVAQEAGVSKGRVVYDHKSKSALLDALIEREINAEVERIEAAVEAHADAPHPELFGRIAAVGRIYEEHDKAIALAMSASMANDDSLQAKMQEWTDLDLKAMADGPKPHAAMMTYFALMGFYSTELFGFHRWSEPDRERILESLRTIYASYPEPDS